MATMFDYTQKSFWGGSWYPYWTLVVATILGGFFGLDHIWLRSPTSGLLKFIVNILTLGLWYFYDMIQILGEKENVMKYGLSAPIVGPLGIGAGMFRDNDPDGPVAKSPYMFLAYLFLLWIPFGFDLFVAGDSSAAIAKFLCYIIIILIPIAFIWGTVNIGYAMLMPKTLFTKGTYRMFPISWIMDSYGPSKLGPVDIPAGSDECSREGLSNVAGSFSSGILGSITGFITIILQSILNIFAPEFTIAAAATGKAVEAVAGTTQVVAGAVGKTAETAGKTVVAAGNSAQQILKSATGSISNAVSSATKTLPSLTSGITQKLGSLTNPQALVALKQSGGGDLSGLSGLSSIETIALLLLFSVLMGGGTLMAVRRMNLSSSFEQKKNESDTPPEPRSI